MPKIKIKDTKKYFKEHWSEPNAEGIKEFVKALKTAKSARAPGEDGISVELYEYGSGKFKKRLLDFLNTL